MGVMGAYQLHKHERGVALVLLTILLSFRVDKAAKNWRIRAKNAYDLDYYKDAHQVEMVKKWVTSQYCKADLEILCPERLSPTSCYAAFDPPLYFVLDLAAYEKKITTEDCSIRVLIDHTKWSDKTEANELKDDELLTYFIAHILDQVRTKSSEYFRAEDRSILEFEQSKLIESSLASLVHLFATPTRVNKKGQTVSTTATEFGMTGRVWTREEVISLMHEAVLWHTHHKRHGTSSTGAALRLSRQQPSFLIKFLPLVKEQIENLELDDSLESRYRNLYDPFRKLNSASTIALDSDHPQSDQCIWSHYEEGTLISQDCLLALETAPLKVRDLDWEGNFSLVFVYLYSGFSLAFALWNLGRARRRQKDVRKSDRPQEDVIETSVVSTRSLSSLSNRSLNKPSSTTSLKATSTKSLVLAVDANAEERKSDQIRMAKWNCVAYFGLSLLLAFVASSTSETIQFTDFLDGMNLVLLSFLSLKPVVSLAADNNRAKLLNPAQNKHYKKLASIEFTESC